MASIEGSSSVTFFSAAFAKLPSDRSRSSVFLPCCCCGSSRPGAGRSARRPPFQSNFFDILDRYANKPRNALRPGAVWYRIITISSSLFSWFQRCISSEKYQVLSKIDEGWLVNGYDRQVHNSSSVSQPLPILRDALGHMASCCNVRLEQRMDSIWLP